MLAVAITLFFALTVTYIINKKEIKNIPQKEIEVSAASFNSDGSYISESVYNNNDYFYISSLNEFLSFNQSMGLYDFYKKTVNLYEDIDLTNVAWSPWGTFCGRFYGNGYTITGAGKTKSKDGGNDHNFGCLFGGLGGAKWQESHWSQPDVYYDYYPFVTELVLKDFYIHTGGYWGTWGFLACDASGDMQISNISVVNCKAVGTSGSSPVDVGGIIGNVPYDSSCNVLIEDCEVINLSVTSPVWGDIGAIAASVESTSDSVALTIRRCVVNNFKYTASEATVNTYVNPYKATKKYFLGIHTKTELALKTHADAKFLSISNCCNSKATSISAFDDWGNVYSSTYGTWFYDSTFNGGYPKLQNWTGKNARYDFYYDQANVATNHGYVQDNSGLFTDYSQRLYLFQPDPTDKTYVSDVLDIVYNSKNTKINVGDKEIEAIPESEYYEFSHWTYELDANDGDFAIHIYTAHFKPVERSVTFVNASGTVAALTNPISPSITSYTIYYGTEIGVSHQSGDGAFTLTFTFDDVNGNEVTVTYDITAEYSLTSADWNNKDKITANTQIQPVVTPKIYTVTFKANADTTLTTQQSWSVYYGTSITYGISNNVVTFTSNKTLSSGTSPVQYSPKDNYYTFEHLKVGSTTYTTGGTISNIASNQTIEVSYLRWYDVTFTTSITGVASSSGLNGKTNPMKLRKGTKITGNYSGYAGKTITYTATYKSESTEIFRYNIANYYIVTNTDDINNLDGTDLTITPTLEFYACTVTMGDISSTVGTRSGYTSPFIVEYGTIVKFTANQTNSIFTYTYTFTYGGSTIKTITYTMKSNQYAMASTMSAENRIWHTNIGASNAVEYEISSAGNGTAMTISPTFGLKEYAGDLN